ncbi:MAG: hypothetical protein IZT59_14015 [Verrucomicrobia bacterium]|nr:hypothetical protein [Verrucomicrobiota bacterium]|tara:strand:+ start:12847 stop:14193 length:1347 start_codon:yes stop_codon:yes gene_type:complete
MSLEQSNKAFWKDRAKALSRRINFGWFLQTVAGPLLVAAALGAIATLVVRREFPQFSIIEISVALGIVLLLVGVVSFVISARRFENPDQSLVRIEAGSGLNTALSAAQAGVSPWPKQTDDLPESLNWHLPKTLAPPIGALVLLALGLLIPISAKIRDTPAPSSQPQAWSQLDSQLEQLADDAMVDEEYIEEMEKRLEQLRSQEEEDWFSHASLEATDSLKETQESNMEKLERDLSDAASALDALTENTEGKTTEQKQKLTEEFEDALKGLQNGAMKPNPGLLDEISKIDPENLGKLTPEQLSHLKENMEKLQESLDSAGQRNGEGDDWSEQLLGDGEDDGEGEGNGPGEDGEGTGSGGIQRGPGHDPNVLRDEKDALDIGDLTALEAKDLSRAIPGDLLQLQDGKHTVDETTSKSTKGGGAAKGKGGDRVWKDSLSPSEQRVLKKYFE